MLLNLALSILPTVIIIAIVLRFDHYEKEPAPLLTRLFIVGAVCVLPAIFLENMVPVDDTGSLSLPGIFIYALLGVALIEEGLKYAAVRLYSYRSPFYNEIYDGIIYCVLVALGFATIENILYVIQYGTATAIIRSITAVPAHAIFAVTMGYYMSMSKVALRNKGFYGWMALIVPVILHGIYDFILFTEFEIAMLFFVVYLIFLYLQAMRLIRNTNNIRPFK